MHPIDFNFQHGVKKRDHGVKIIGERQHPKWCYYVTENLIKLVEISFVYEILQSWVTGNRNLSSSCCGHSTLVAVVAVIFVEMPRLYSSYKLTVEKQSDWIVSM